MTIFFCWSVSLVSAPVRERNHGHATVRNGFTLRYLVNVSPLRGGLARGNGMSHTPTKYSLETAALLGYKLKRAKRENVRRVLRLVLGLRYPESGPVPWRLHPVLSLQTVPGSWDAERP